MAEGERKRGSGIKSREIFMIRIDVSVANPDQVQNKLMAQILMDDLQGALRPELSDTNFRSGKVW